MPCFPGCVTQGAQPLPLRAECGYSQDMNFGYQHTCIICGLPAGDGFLMIDPGLLLQSARNGTLEDFSDETGWPVTMWLSACKDCSSHWGDDMYYIHLEALRWPHEVDNWEAQLKAKNWFAYSNWDFYANKIRNQQLTQSPPEG